MRSSLLHGHPPTLLQYRLVDLLLTTDPDAPIQTTEFLDGLTVIVKAPKLGSVDAAGPLGHAVSQFRDWLVQMVDVETWFPSIDLNTVLSLPRKQFIRMTGNLSKHGFLRTYKVASHWQKLLELTGHSVTLQEASLALSDRYERFHTDILNNHASTLAEFLNNIRWGIFDYLQPVFKKRFSWTEDGPPKYRFAFPNDVDHPYAKDVFWELIDAERSKPYMERFRVHRWVKLRY